MSRPSHDFWPSLLRETRHHALTAFTIACAILVLEHLHLTDGINAATLRLATEVFDIASPGERTETTPVQLVVVNQKQYLGAFQETSPLDRTALTQLLAGIIAATPLLVAVDIDLSPPLDPKAQEARKQLDKLIDRSHVPLILPLPILTIDPAINTDRMAWARERCERNKHIHFAFTEVMETSGLVLTYDPAFPSLGIMAREVEADLMRGSQGPPSRPRTEWPANALCQALTANPDSGLTEFRELLRGADAAPLDAAVASRISAAATTCDIPPPNATPDAAVCRGLTNAVVFLGGSYDERDRFQTAAGAVEGAAIHAATYGSGIDTLSDGWLLPLDVVIGVLLALPLTRIWQQQRRYRRAYARHSHPDRGAEPWPPSRTVLTWIGIRLLPVAAIALSMFAFWVLMRRSAYLFASGTWINPGALVFGMFADSLLASREELPHGSGGSALVTFTRLDLIWKGLLWILGLGIWISHLLH